MKREYIIERQGKQFVLYEGLLDEAHQQGLCRISTTLLQIPDPENGNVAVVHAEVETSKGSFSGIGDASPTNVGRPIIPHIIRMAECVPLSAEILTPSGWKHHDELTVGEDVMAYDSYDNRCRPTALHAVTRFTADQAGPLMRLTSRSFDVRCTQDHSWVTVNSTNRPELRKTHALRAGDKIIVAATAESGSSDVTPDEAAILGWLATDGTVREAMVGKYGPYTRATIRQSKPDTVDEIRALTVGVATEHVAQARQRDFGTYISDCLPQHSFSLSTQFVHDLFEKAGFRTFKDLTGIVFRLTTQARQAMLEAMLRGDGFQNGNGIWTFGKKRKEGVMEAFEILATLNGIALGRPRMSSVGEVPLRTLRNNRHITTSYLRREIVDPEPVWCPTTAYGTWIMRLDGTITITGNTRAKARAMRDAVNIGVTALEELGDNDDQSEAHRDEGAIVTAPVARSQAADQGYSTEIPKASPYKLASANQLATVAKLSRLLGQPETPSEHMTSAEASERITVLSREYNERKDGTSPRRSA